MEGLEYKHAGDGVFSGVRYYASSALEQVAGQLEEKSLELALSALEAALQGEKSSRVRERFESAVSSLKQRQQDLDRHEQEQSR